VPGLVALVGAGEFLPAMAELDASLLAVTGRRRPRVVIVPTASHPDGRAVFERWAVMGRDHFEGLGAEVETALIRDRSDADDPEHVQAIGEADLVYLSGGKPDHLLEALRASAAWRAMLDAHARGAILVGCSAGAMVLGARQLGFRRGIPTGWRAALGAAGDVAVIPHYDAFPEPFGAAMALRAPSGMTVLGIDEDTAVVGRDGSWEVRGRSRVTVWRGRHRQRLHAGDTFRVGPSDAEQQTG
jgi:cyanophycinase